MRDPGFRKRLIKAVAWSMVFSAPFGLVGYVASAVSLGASARAGNLQFAFNAAAIVFWIAFALQFITGVWKTAAVLDMDRRVRLAQELFKRNRHPR